MAKSIKLNLDDDFLQTIFVCAIRYSLGRQTYMPTLVTDYITPYIPALTDKTLGVIERDISQADYYGHPDIDKPVWMKFLANIRKEQENRRCGNAKQ